MANVPTGHSGPSAILSLSGQGAATRRVRSKPINWKFGVAASAILLLSLATFVPAQSSPKVTTLNPAAGKVNDSVTLTGENLGKDSVSAVFLSDDKDDYKATVVEQGGQKIILKVPQVKAGAYNISIQEGDKIFILPLRFTVQS
jgi:hypothetical protein